MYHVKTLKLKVITCLFDRLHISQKFDILIAFIFPMSRFKIQFSILYMFMVHTTYVAVLVFVYLLYVLVKKLKDTCLLLVRDESGADKSKKRFYKFITKFQI